MRPLLSVVLVPSMPMKEDRLSTAGSLQNHVGERLLAAGHGGEGNVLRTFGNAEDDAGVLHREKAFGNVDVQQNGGDQGADGDQQRDRAILQHDFQRTAVEGDDSVESVFRFAVEPAFLFSWVRGAAVWRTSWASTSAKRTRKPGW